MINNSKPVDLAVDQFAKENPEFLNASIPILKGEDVSNSSSDEEETSVEALLAQKDIEKLTKGNLDIKQLIVDIGAMRRFVHTPKNAIRAAFDTVPYQDCLQEKGFLLFNPNDRPTNTIFAKLQ